MVSIRSLAVTAVAVLGVRVAHTTANNAPAQAPATTGPTITVKSAAALAGNCLTEANATRSAAGLKAFTAGTTLAPRTPAANDPLILYACGKPNSNATISLGSTTGALLAVLPPQATTPTCQNAVDHWKKNGAGLKLPPAYSTTATQAVFKDQPSLNFLSLFNNNGPSQTFQCETFTCTFTPNTTTTTSSSGGSSGTQAAAAATDQSGILCISLPGFSDNTAPYTDKQWSAIMGSVSAGTATLPSLIVLAASVIGLALY